MTNLKAFEFILLTITLLALIWVIRFSTVNAGIIIALVSNLIIWVLELKKLWK